MLSELAVKVQNAMSARLMLIFQGMRGARTEQITHLDFTTGWILNHLRVTGLSVCAPFSLTTSFIPGNAARVVSWPNMT